MTEKNTIANYLKSTGNKQAEIKVALVDCDGVLYDSMKNHTRAWVKLMKKNGVKCTRDEFYLYEGMTGAEIIKLLFKRGSGKNITDDEARELYKVKSRYFKELGEPAMMSGTTQVLSTLRDAGIKNVLVTGSGEPLLLERIDRDYAGLFAPERITAADTKHGKPSPEPYMKAQLKAGAKPCQCIVIENAPLGVQSGHASGSFTIGVTTGPVPEKDLYKAGADIVYPDMNTLASALPALLEAFKTTQQA
ncbi:MAG: HAD hydrolase-like protein [Sodaliphilus pleomorphus]|uniref:HAD family hydrolase n=1 Tax=Sodaliphilus pleomorphus TaxID=2606626 RepID=UPI002A765632|nr:HAD family hydrolase [Sodaliphilus pleomorphus]MDY2831355.1 HAD hydrolase-like protein [Sodaliphilus pleomorphus]